ncbi:MAG: tRNA nucleotidyltransferase/poly(A) polymerase family protein [Anaerolineae bacterium]
MSRQPVTIGAVEAYLARAGEAYLVGSANWGLPGLVADHDYALHGDTVAVAADVAQAFGGKSVVMDAERRHVRLALRAVGVLDLAPLADGSLTADLATRDFTLNAVAAALPDRRPVYDPFRGLTDLRHGLVRQVSATALMADPLRVLRAVRLLSERGYQIESGTLASMATATPLLQRVQAERLHAELMRSLSGPGWHAAATLLLDLGAWQALPLPLAPDGGHYRQLLDRLRAGRQALDRAGEVAAEGSTALPPRQLAALAVVAAAMLAAGLAPDAMAEAGRFLRFTRREAEGLSDIGAAYHAVAAGDGDAASLADRYGAHAHAAAALAGRTDVLEGLLALRAVPAGLLPDGGELLRRFARRPGPWLGAALRSLRQAALRGDIADREAAWQLAASLMRRDNGDDATRMLAGD